jgi:hypothetical protein
VGSTEVNNLEVLAKRIQERERVSPDGSPTTIGSAAVEMIRALQLATEIVGAANMPANEGMAALTLAHGIMTGAAGLRAGSRK